MSGRRLLRRLVGLLLVAVTTAPAAADQVKVLDDFETLEGWTATAAPGASLEIAHDAGRNGKAMRLDFDFRGGAGWVTARKAFPMPLPANFAFTMFVRGDAPPNNLEFKVVGPKGDNVWWYRKREMAFPSDWQQLTVRKSRLDFAWGPQGGGSPKQLGYVEIALTASTGGKGSVWIDDLELEERAPDGRTDLATKASASTSQPEHGPALVLDGDLATEWRSGEVASEQWLLLDFQRRHEYGGLVIDWDAQDYATSYKVEVSNDGTEWTSAYHSPMGSGGRTYVYMPDGESRYLRLDLLQSSRGQGYGIRSITVMPVSFSTSLNDFFSAVAADAPPGAYPKYFSNEQTYWTVVGVNGGDTDALFNEEGMLETDPRGFSLEPFLYVDGSLVTWHDVERTQSLEQGFLPLPTVEWHYDWLTLRVSTFAAGPPGASVLYARYEVESKADTPHDVVLFVAIRPFQVLPPWQMLNMIGGVTSIRTFGFDGRTVLVNGSRAVVGLTPPDHFGAATFEQGFMRDYLLEGKLPRESAITDPFGYASGALEYRLSLGPGGRQRVDVAVPFHDPSDVMARAATEGDTLLDTERIATVAEWKGLLGRVDFRLPPSAWPMVRTAETTLAYVLINRDGPAIQPGSRTYARSWIRDGALTSTALLELGHTEEPRQFLSWYTGFQQKNGRIPCCVDQRGADPTPENDSEGEFIFAVGEYYRYTRDVGFVWEMWPHVVRAVNAIASLRAERMTAKYQTPAERLFYGLLPDSISHEGYSGNPVHSYWDDFWALKGLKDAADLAVIVGDEGEATRMAALRDDFHGTLYASITAAMKKHKIDYLPASADLGDLDPSSTAIAVTPCGELANLPRGALDRTFDLYWADVEKRLHRKGPPGKNEGHSAYELRIVEVLVRMGQRERAFTLLESLMRDQRPPEWNEWQEITWADPKTPQFIGDMPHTWVAAGFIRALRSLLAYEDPAEDALVLAAGVPAAWLDDPEGIAVKRMPTHHGVLTYALRREGDHTLRLTLEGDLDVPPGGIIVRPPLERPVVAATVNGEAVAEVNGVDVVVRSFPADVVLKLRPR